MNEFNIYQLLNNLSVTSNNVDSIFILHITQKGVITKVNSFNIDLLREVFDLDNLH